MLLGKIIDKRYQVVLVLSSGELTQTYLAQDTRLPGHPLCVVKHLPKATSNNTELWQSASQILAREAEVFKQLGNHDQIPQFLNYFEKHQALYLVREYIKGVPLSTELLPDSRWSESQVVQLLQDVLSILKFVHERGFIHLDIKPDNIIKRKQDGRLVLINFGLSKQLTPIANLRSRISALSPTNKLHPKSDLHALGLICIQALTGQHLTGFAKDTDAGEILSLSQVQVSTELVSLLDKMVRYDIKDCYKSATEVLQDLQPLANLYLPTQQSKVPLQSSAIAARLSQTFSSQENTSSVLSVNRSGSPDNSDVSTSNDRSLLLIGLSIGISTTIVLVIGILWLLSTTPENLKYPASISPENGNAQTSEINEAMNY